MSAVLLVAVLLTAPPPQPAPPVPAVQSAIERVTFASVVERAVAHATTSVIAAEEARRAEGVLTQVRSAALPSLFASGTYTLLDADRVSRGAVVAAKQQEGANLTLSVPLLAPSRWASWRHADQAVDVARAGQADIVRQSALLAARTYLLLLAQHRLLEVSRSAVDTAAARLQFAKARQRGGVGNTLDEIRAEEQLATSNAQLQTSFATLVRVQEALGLTVGADQPLDAAEDPELPAPPADDAASVDAKRPDLVAAKTRLQAAQSMYRDGWTDWLPSLIATGQPFYQNPATPNLPRTGWQVFLVLSLPVGGGAVHNPADLRGWAASRPKFRA